MDPQTLYAQYLAVWGQDYSGHPDLMEHAALIFSAMNAYADQGIFQLGPDNKYYPAGTVPANYNPVPVPGQPGSVSYIPAPPAAGATNGTTSTGSPSPTNGTGVSVGGLQLSPMMILLGVGVLYLFSRK